MAEKIGFQDGIEAVRQRLDTIDPGKAGYDKLFGKPGTDYGSGEVEGTLVKLKAGHNEFEDRLTAIEDALAGRPF
jgi:hypothetical protein